MSKKETKEVIPMSDDPVMEEILENENLLREGFTIEDFMDYHPTREILEIERMNHFEDVLGKKVDDFYQSEREFHNDNLSNLFYYDLNGNNISDLKNILWKFLKPRYDLEKLYTSPHLAISIIENYDTIVEERKKRREEKRLREIRSNRDLGVKYDWNNKEFKK